VIRIWAKVIKDDKIVRQYVFEKFESIDYAKFFEYVRDICEHLDVATPVIIKTHLFNYAKYNNVRFTKNDFIEPIDFDKFVLENALI
jgi:hypothetical protein